MPQSISHTGTPICARATTEGPIKSNNTSLLLSQSAHCDYQMVQFSCEPRHRRGHLLKRLDKWLYLHCSCCCYWSAAMLPCNICRSNRTVASTAAVVVITVSNKVMHRIANIMCVCQCGRYSSHFQTTTTTESLDLSLFAVVAEHSLFVASKSTLFTYVSHHSPRSLFCRIL